MKIKAEKQKEWEKFVEANSNDPYSRSALNYMTRWANLMEAELEDNKNLTQKSVEKLSNIADFGDISGAVHELAKGYLGYYWEHGEQLQAIFGKKVVIRS